ncbi:MAG: DsbA family protein, partial [Actinomycetes bacterium]
QMLEETAAAGEWTLQYKTMTFMDKNLVNTASTRAALAAACSASAADTYSAYNREVYRNQPANEVRGAVGYTDELLRDTIPATVGITGEALTGFQACYDDKATADFVKAVDESAYNDGVTGTPTLTVNGKKLDLNQVTDFTPDGVKQFILANA